MQFINGEEIINEVNKNLHFAAGLSVAVGRGLGNIHPTHSGLPPEDPLCPSAPCKEENKDTCHGMTSLIHPQMPPFPHVLRYTDGCCAGRVACTIDGKAVLALYIKVLSRIDQDHSGLQKEALDGGLIGAHSGRALGPW